MSANNGASDNGYVGGISAAKLARVIAVYERLASELNPTCPNCNARANLTALRTTTLLINGADTIVKQQRAPSVILAAIAKDANRRAGRPKGKARQLRTAPKPHGGGYSATVRKRRELSADLLARFDADEPRPLPSKHPGARGIGPLVRRGYLKARGDGYVRTAKPFDVTAGRA